MMKIGTVFVLAGVAMICLGQGMDSFDSHVADFRILMSKRVQADVGITQAQLVQLNAYADENRKEIRAYQNKVAKQGKDPNKIPDNDPVLIRYFVELQGKILAKLTKTQLRRLRELTLQAEGLKGMLDPVVAKRIGISETQLQKATSIFRDGFTRENKIRQEVYNVAIQPYRDSHPKTREEAKAISDKINQAEQEGLQKRNNEIKIIATQTKKALDAVVTAKQYKAYTALEGKLFESK